MQYLLCATGFLMAITGSFTGLVYFVFVIELTPEQANNGFICAIAALAGLLVIMFHCQNKKLVELEVKYHPRKPIQYIKV